MSQETIIEKIKKLLEINRADAGRYRKGPDMDRDGTGLRYMVRPGKRVL